MNNQITDSQAAEELLKRSLLDFSLRHNNKAMFEALHDGSYEVVKNVDTKPLKLKFGNNVFIDARTGEVVKATASIDDEYEAWLRKQKTVSGYDELYSLAKLIYNHIHDMEEAFEALKEMYHNDDFKSFNDYSVCFSILKRLYNYE